MQRSPLIFLSNPEIDLDANDLDIIFPSGESSMGPDGQHVAVPQGSYKFPIAGSSAATMLIQRDALRGIWVDGIVALPGACVPFEIVPTEPVALDATLVTGMEFMLVDRIRVSDWQDSMQLRR